MPKTLNHVPRVPAMLTPEGRAFIDLAYPRFFKRELDYEDRAAIEALLKAAGVDPAGFEAFTKAEGPELLAGHQQAAEAAGVFAVPTFVVDGELFKLKGDVFGSPSFEKKATSTVTVTLARPLATPGGET